MQGNLFNYMKPEAALIVVVSLFLSWVTVTTIGVKISASYMDGETGNSIVIIAMMIASLVLFYLDYSGKRFGYDWLLNVIFSVWVIATAIYNYFDMNNTDVQYAYVSIDLGLYLCAFGGFLLLLCTLITRKMGVVHQDPRGSAAFPGGYGYPYNGYPGNNAYPGNGPNPGYTKYPWNGNPPEDYSGNPPSSENDQETAGYSSGNPYPGNGYPNNGYPNSTYPPNVPYPNNGYQNNGYPPNNAYPGNGAYPGNNGYPPNGQNPADNPGNNGDQSRAGGYGPRSFDNTGKGA